MNIESGRDQRITTLGRFRVSPEGNENDAALRAENPRCRDSRFHFDSFDHKVEVADG